MRVLSLFDGISCAMVALERQGFTVDAYYAAEIDRHAICISSNAYPSIQRMGDVRGITKDMVGDIDLLIGGSPCQDLSLANTRRAGLKGERSGLFYEYVRIKNEISPTWWVLENVASMSSEARLEITSILGCEPVEINAALVSAQKRRRLFWTNIPVSQMPMDRCFTLKDVFRPTADEYFYRIEPSMLKAFDQHKVKLIGMGDKTQTVTTKQRRWNNTGFVEQEGRLRYFTPEECELLQGLPEGYTRGISIGERYKTIGNGFNVDVVAHILSFIPKGKI